MRNYTPIVRVFIIYLLCFAAGPAWAKEEKEDLPEQYLDLVKATQVRPAVIRQIFSDSYLCAPDMSQDKVKAADNTAKRQETQQNAQLTQDYKKLEKTDTEVKAAIRAKLEKLKADTSGVDMCKGENNSVEKLFKDAKEQAISAAKQKIDAVAKELNSSVARLKKASEDQLRKNLSERSGDISNLNMAGRLPFREANRTAGCSRVVAALQRGEADNLLKDYISKLDKLDKSIETWKESKKAEIIAEVEAQTGQGQKFMLAKKTCGESAPIAAAADGKTKASKPEEPKPAAPKKDEPKVAEAEKPKAKPVSEAKASERPKTSTTEAAPKLAAPKGENNTNDVAQQALAENAPAKDPDDPWANAPSSAEGITKMTRGPIPGSDPAPAANDTKNTAPSPDYIVPVQGLDGGAAERAVANVNAGVPVPPEAMQEPVPLTQSLRSSYQSNPIFKARDLDFYSSKDTTIIQKALNQVGGGNELDTDGVFGSRTTARLDAVMQDPLQKAAFLKALREQMR